MENDVIKADDMIKAEEQVCSMNPSMFRNNPIQFSIWFAFIGSGATLALMHGWGSFLSIIGLILVAVGVISLFVWWLQKYNIVLTITNKRTMYRRGIFSKQNIEIFHHNVRNIETKQSFFDRVFGVGSISIASSGQDGYDIIAQGMRDPEGIKQTINQFVLDQK